MDGANIFVMFSWFADCQDSMLPLPTVSCERMSIPNSVAYIRFSTFSCFSVIISLYHACRQANVVCAADYVPGYDSVQSKSPKPPRVSETYHLPGGVSKVSAAA